MVQPGRLCTQSAVAEPRGRATAVRETSPRGTPAPAAPPPRRLHSVGDGAAGFQEEVTWDARGHVCFSATAGLPRGAGVIRSVTWEGTCHVACLTEMPLLVPLPQPHQGGPARDPWTRFAEPSDFTHWEARGPQVTGVLVSYSNGTVRIVRVASYHAHCRM